MARFIIILTLLFTWSGLSYSQQSKAPLHLDDIYKLPASLYDVKGVGPWKAGNDSGQLRLVIARTNKRDEVYLQWVKWNEKGPEKVVSTVMIKEIQASANYKTTFIRIKSMAGKRQVVLGLENLHDKSSSKAEIEIIGVGRYNCSL
jgi:hypothetical protein